MQAMDALEATIPDVTGFEPLTPAQLATSTFTCGDVTFVRFALNCSFTSAPYIYICLLYIYALWLNGRNCSALLTHVNVDVIRYVLCVCSVCVQVHIYVYKYM